MWSCTLCNDPRRWCYSACAMYELAPSHDSSSGALATELTTCSASLTTSPTRGVRPGTTWMRSATRRPPSACVTGASRFTLDYFRS